DLRRRKNPLYFEYFERYDPALGLARLTETEAWPATSSSRKRWSKCMPLSHAWPNLPQWMPTLVP
ncbi:MAG: hypothetical protein QGG67_21220, partial [Gammaproteobacteria bacterium]|nr:hypothetical protein [Gammaproteobacteria bacterium]